MSSLPASSVGVPGVTTPTEDDLSPGGSQVWQPLCVSRPSPSTQYHVVATASTLPLYPPPGLLSLHLGSSPPEDTYWGDVQTLNPCVSPPGGEHLPMDYLTRWCCLATNFYLLVRCCIATDSYVRSIYAAGLSSGFAWCCLITDIQLRT